MFMKTQCVSEELRNLLWSVAKIKHFKINDLQNDSIG